MKAQVPRFFMTACILAFIPLLAISCATSSGGTLAKDIAIEAGSESQSHTPGGTPAAKGLEILSDPDGAEVFLNGAFQGLTPLVIENLAKGRYMIEVRKAGFFTMTEWIDFPGTYMLVKFPMLRVYGFIQLSISPPDATVTIGGSRYSPGLSRIPSGAYEVSVRAFGYQDYRTAIEVPPLSVVNLDVVLAPAPFAISKVSMPKRVFNPDNPGVLGTLEMSFEVTGPGSGDVRVVDSGSREVFHAAYPVFTTWHQPFKWDFRDSTGTPLPDGEYRLVFTGRADESGPQDMTEASFTIDRIARITLRSAWSGSSGLLFAPTAETIPEGSWDLSFLGMVFDDGSVFRAPIQISSRIGIGGSVELLAETGLILSPGAAPFSFAFSGRYSFLPPSSPLGFGAAVEGKAAIQLNSAGVVVTTDTFSNFSGVSLGFPLQLVLGPVSLLAEPAVIASLWQPYDSAVPPAVTFSSWLYIRAGLLFDFGALSGGLSMSVRTLSLPDGILSYGLPLLSSLEVNWLIPGSHIYLAADLIGVFDSPTSFYFMGGGGLGIIY
jgi:hypothetical protein